MSKHIWRCKRQWLLLCYAEIVETSMQIYPHLCSHSLQYLFGLSLFLPMMSLMFVTYIVWDLTFKTKLYRTANDSKKIQLFWVELLCHFYWLHWKEISKPIFCMNVCMYMYRCVWMCLKLSLITQYIRKENPNSPHTLYVDASHEEECAIVLVEFKGHLRSPEVKLRKPCCYIISRQEAWIICIQIIKYII